METDTADELISQLMALRSKLDTLNARQDETNSLMRDLMETINSNSQELLELRQEMQKKG